MLKVEVRNRKIKTLATQWLRAGLDAVDPGEAIRRRVRVKGRTLRIDDRRYDLETYDRVVVVGAGKAAARMGSVLEGLLGGRVNHGLLVVKYGHGQATKRLEVLEAGHPVPDPAGEAAAERLLGLVRSLSARDLLLVLISGGASSLLPVPAPGVELEDKRHITQALLRSGASIQEVNAVRKHLSGIKGGRLAAATKATVVSLILSDVLGDDLGAIGSGPTAPDPTTYAQATAILKRYRVWEGAPPRVRHILESGTTHEALETPKPGSPVFRRVSNHIIGNNRAAVSTVARAARSSGFRPLVLSTTLTGEAREAAHVFGAIGREIVHAGQPIRRPACILAGGELTVSVRGEGKGGRAQEFALAAALSIAGLQNVWVMAFGTDGTDGPTDAAGAVVDGETVARASCQGIDPVSALDRNDAYPFFQKVGGHLITGPTGTNVNDLYLLVVSGK